jgi:uncharacterized Zn finger protein
VPRCPMCGERDVIVLTIRSFTMFGSCPNCGTTWVQVVEEQRGVAPAKATPDRPEERERFVTDWALAD